MSENTEYEEVTIRLPKEVMTFLRAVEPNLKESVKKYIQSCILASICSDMEYAACHGEPFFRLDALIDKFELRKAMGKHGFEIPNYSK